MDSTSAMDWKQSMTFETDVEDQPGIMPHVGQKTGDTCAFTMFQNGSSSSLVGRKKPTSKPTEKIQNMRIIRRKPSFPVSRRPMR